ncbi:MAG: hypothetical protein Q9201_006660 [Fulgogasparrea decipioides]
MESDTQEQSDRQQPQSNGHDSQQPPNNDSNNHSPAMANGQLDSQTNGDPTTQSKGTPTHQQFADPDHQTLSSEQIPKPDNEVIDPKQSLEPFAWDDLETRFLQKMEECQRREEEIEKEFREWCHVCPFTPSLNHSSFSPSNSHPWRRTRGE